MILQWNWIKIRKETY